MRGARYRIGIDVGGTFTDFALVCTETDPPVVVHHKVPSTPARPAEAIAAGLVELLERAGVPAARVAYLGHGTTVATNQLIERRGARTGLLTTAGFRDVLEIARQTRPHLYDYSVRRPPPLVPRRWRLEIDERIDVAGDVLRPIDRTGVERAARELAAAGVEAVAICFLHAYRNPAHEIEAQAVVRSVMPASVRVCTSSEVLPEFREFERVSTTCANAFLAPRMDEYLGDFLHRLEGVGIAVEPYTFHSNGGLMSPDTARRLPVRTCLSGPAAGVVGAAASARAAGWPDLVTFDVGGTSTDVSLITGAAPGYRLERSVAGYVVKSPMIDVQVIGAGGGSIAWLDEGGALRVGPHSAGASPGPAAYGVGGSEPTLTDANVVLRRLDPHALLGGRLPLDPDAAGAAIATLGSRIGRDPVFAASGVVQVAVASIARAIRAVSTERGHDLEGFALMAFGGAGPLLASEVAREVRCPRVIVPVAPGAMCARGILVADVSRDYVRTSACRADAEGWTRTVGLLQQMRREAEAWLAAENVTPERREYRFTVDARYTGQGFEVPVEVTGNERLAELGVRFHDAHRARYGYALPERSVELVNCRVQGIGRTGMDVATHLDAGTAPPSPVATREVYFTEQGWLATPVHAREALASGARLEGPLVVEEASSTTLVLPGDRLEVDAWGNLVIGVAALDSREEGGRSSG